MKLSIQWDKTVLMDVFKVGASSYRFSQRIRIKFFGVDVTSTKHVTIQILATSRLDCEYEVEYNYDFRISNQ